MRTLSSADIQAMNAQETGDSYHCLITISHPNLPAPIALTSDAVPTVSNGVTFVPFPFLFQIPDDRSDQLPIAKLQIDNTELAILQAIRSVGNAYPTVLMQIVLGSDPDTIEAEWTMTMRNVVWDMNQITMDLRFDQILDEPFPGDLVTPSTIPGVFLMEQ
jgi:hypothetical protein